MKYSFRIRILGVSEFGNLFPNSDTSPNCNISRTDTVLQKGIIRSMWEIRRNKYEM
jgi:hypothetical protein